MKSCPGCNFLVDDDATVCQFCGADSGAAPAASAPTDGVVTASRESVSTKVTAGVIVAASLSVLGIGAWALHSSPPTSNFGRAVSSAAPKVDYRSISVTNSGTPYRLDVAVGDTDPDLTNGVRSAYATARELDVVRIPSAGGADLASMLTTFASGWPTTELKNTTTAAGAGLSFVLSNDPSLTHGTLIDAGAGGVFLVAVKAPKGSSFTPVDAAVLKRAIATLRVG